ncbi:MAG: hypothetical protein E7265_02710 [Lachnospiraceae bacterium]|nr:hypothetical protein [Lachnospiraceae bacterium]
MLRLNYGNFQFLIEDGVLNYAKELKQFKELEDGSIKLFKNRYDYYGDLDNVVKNLQDDLTNILNEIILHYVKYWNAHGDYSMDAEEFASELFLNDSSQLAIYTQCDYITEKYAEIMMSKEEAEEYRRMRKANRGKWEGGGFGLAGAMKGAATAGSINLVTGMGHSIVNGIGNALDSMAANSEKKKIYKNPNTLSGIIAALRKDLNRVFSTQIDLLNSSTDDYYIEPEPSKIKTAATILTNISKPEVPEEDIENNVYEILDLNPYYAPLYTFLLNRYGDSESKLDELADIFSCKDALDSEKDKILKEGIKNLTYDSLEASCESLKKTNEIIAYYGINTKYSNTTQTSAVNKYENAKIDSIVDDIDYHSEESVNNAIETLKNLELTVITVDSTIETINEKYQQQYEQDCCFNGIKYDSPATANIARAENDNIESVLNGVDFYNDNAVADAISKIKTLTLTQFNIDDVISNIEKQTRTLDGILYDSKENLLSALSYKNNLLAQAKELINNKRHKDAINVIRTAQIAENSRTALTYDASNYLVSANEETFSLAKEFEIKKEKGDTFVYGLIAAIVCVFLGWIISNFLWHFILYVGYALGAILLIQAVMTWHENKQIKKAYKKVKEFKKMGYIFNDNSDNTH